MLCPMGSLKNKRHVGVALLCLLALASAIAPTAGAGKAAKHPRTQRVSMLYALSAGAGRLIPKKGSAVRYELVLKKLDHSVIWFSDRPVRRSGAFPTRALADSWRRLGFAADPPNAALVYGDGSGRAGRTAIVELSHPRFAKGGLSFVARVLDPKTVKAPNLAERAAAADRNPALKLSDPSLFIDNSEVTHFNGCVMRVSTVCINRALGRTNRETELFVTYSNLSGSSFTNAFLLNSEFNFATLRGFGLSDSNLNKVNFEHSDLTGADFHGTETESSRFQSADLTNADISSAHVILSWFEYATLEGVDFSRSLLGGSQLNSTLMREANFSEATLEGLNLNSTEMAFSNLSNATLNSVRLRNGNIADSTLTNAQLTDVDFTNSDVMDVDFSGSELNQVDFSEARIGGSVFTGTRLCGVTMPEGNVVNSGC